MKKLLLLIVTLLLSSPALAEDSISLLTEEFAPYQFYEGEGDNKIITGISIEIVQEIQKQLGNSDPIKVLPWNRALKLLTKNKNNALFSTARTPDREDKYKWVGPLSKLEMVFFKKAGSDITFRVLRRFKWI